MESVFSGDSFALFRDQIQYTIHNTHSRKQLYRHVLVTGFGYLLAIIRPKTCVSKITRNHTNTVTNKSQIDTNDNWSAMF